MENNPQTSLIPRSGYNLGDIARIALRSRDFLGHVRGQVFRPDSEKKPPVFNLSDLVKLCNTNRSDIARRIADERDPNPKGELVSKTLRHFTLAEARTWARTLKSCYQRKPGELGSVICVANFKGGVSKTTITLNLAHALSLKGYKICLIDLDSQGSLTNQMGLSPEDVRPENTFAPLAAGETSSLRPAILPTYWDGIDLVPASVALNKSDFDLASRQSKDSAFPFWFVLRQGLLADGLLAEYDFVLIDTPPALSYLTLNAFWAADNLLVPLPPEGPDFASSVSFWTLLVELMHSVQANLPVEQQKTYDWVRVLPSKVDATKSTTAAMMEWLRTVYGPEMMPAEIPLSTVVSHAGARFGSIYDMDSFPGAAKTYKRAREAYDELATRVDDLTRLYTWSKPL